MRPSINVSSTGSYKAYALNLVDIAVAFNEKQVVFTSNERKALNCLKDLLCQLLKSYNYNNKVGFTADNTLVLELSKEIYAGYFDNDKEQPYLGVRTSVHYDGRIIELLLFAN